MMWIKLSLENVRPIGIVIVYRPPQGSYVRYCEMINEANLKNNTDMVLLGDFNINYIDETTPAYRELDLTTKSLGLKQLINCLTKTVYRDGSFSEINTD